MKVLIVDDQSVIIDMVINILRRYYEDFTFLRASNGREACKIAGSELPVIIIMDWEMPEMTGIEALQRLKKNPNTSKIHVLITSSFSSSANVSKALEEGAIDYIRKPIDEIELVARVRSVLMLHTAMEKLTKAKLIAEASKDDYELLINSIVPPKIMREYNLNGGKFIPKRYLDVCVVFIDLVDFTRKTNTLSAAALIQELRTLFTAFDVVFKNYDCIRIKTIGDAYLGVSGIPDENSGGKTNALNAINACREIRDYIDQRNATMTSEKDMWSVRIGVATGAVVGAILSEDNCLFDIFGDTVNLASRVQHLGNPNEIWSCEKTAALVKDAVGVESMGMHDVKGKGVLHIYRIAESDRHSATGEAKPKVKIVTKYKL